MATACHGDRRLSANSMFPPSVHELLYGPSAAIKGIWDDNRTGTVSRAGSDEAEGTMWSGAESNASSASCTPRSPFHQRSYAGSWSSSEFQAAVAYARSQIPQTASQKGCGVDRQTAGPDGLPASPVAVCRSTTSDFAALQPKLLKQINSYHTKEELLSYVTTCHALLDDINLTTCVYRLARMYSNVRHPTARQLWSCELQDSFAFQQLLRALQTHLIQAQLQLMQQGRFKGFDARCVSNLIWAIVKLEVSTEPGCIGHDLVQNVSPLVLHFLSSSSSQGLANLLWAYSKMAVPMQEVMMMIVAEMSIRLQCESSNFDAQALSNSIWALAHIRNKVSDLDNVVGMPGLTVRFMIGIASCAMAMLKTLQTRSDLMHMQASMLESERRFSCQALVNICWSFASMLGEDCGKVPAIRNLFACIRSEALIRLRATSSALQLNRQWVFRLQGGFNEQALSNIVYAFDKAQLLDKDILQSVYGVATLRLERSLGRPSFKPQELCTLLRAAQSNIAQPWAFLDKLQGIIVSSPYIVQEWSAAERAELDRALALLDMYRTTVMLQQMKMEQQHAVRYVAAQAGMTSPAVAGVSLFPQV